MWEQEAGDDSRASSPNYSQARSFFSGDLAVWDGHTAMVVGNGLSSYWTVGDPYMSEWCLQ